MSQNSHSLCMLVICTLGYMSSTAMFMLGLKDSKKPKLHSLAASNLTNCCNIVAFLFVYTILDVNYIYIQHNYVINESVGTCAC